MHVAVGDELSVFEGIGGVELAEIALQVNGFGRFERVTFGKFELRM